MLRCNVRRNGQGLGKGEAALRDLQQDLERPSAAGRGAAEPLETRQGKPGPQRAGTSPPLVPVDTWRLGVPATLWAVTASFSPRRKRSLGLVPRA